VLSAQEQRTGAAEAWVDTPRWANILSAPYLAFMSQLFVPNSIALRNFDAVFKHNTFGPWSKKVVVTFHPTYVAMHPVGLALLAAMGDIWRKQHLEVSGTMNPDIRSIPFLQRMGLFGAMGFDDPKLIATHEETGRFIPLRKIRTGDELEEFIKTIDPLLHTTRENSRVIKHVFSELIRNVIEHAGAGAGANVCATYNRRKNKISIGISDSGKGLFNSIARSHSLKDDRDAILKALTPGVTGSTSRIGGNEQNAGAGLFFTKCIAQSTRNNFLIYSGTAYFKLKVAPVGQRIVFNPDPLLDKCSLKTGIPNFEGTLIGLDINIGDQSAFRDLIDRIGDAYQLGVKKSKKDFTKRIRFT